MNSIPVTANATFCATLVDSWATLGATTAFVAPGSRSTPLALALAADDRIAVHICHDERVAAFAALGHGRTTGVPAVILCSSGTAGTHFHGAVVEADLSRVPMLVCTADRPPELWDRGAPQTIRQTNLFGPIVRAFAEPGPPDDGDPTTWRGLAVDTFTAATAAASPGPVHLNLSFRDPLTGSPGPLPPASSDVVGTPPAGASPDDIAALVAMAVDGTKARRGVIVAGRGETPPALVIELGRRLGWPIVSDHRSGCRVAASADGPGAIARFDALLRHGPWANDRRPDVILRLGEIVASKSTSQWITACAASAEIVSARPWGRLIDPERVALATPAENGLVEGMLAALPAEVTPSDEAAIWADADARADAAVTAVLATEATSEPAIARAVVASVPEGGVLMLSSSMPVRDVEWFAPNRADIDVQANRGANGIDGIVSTAIGIAATGKPTTCLIGDVAFLHDSTALVALAARQSASGPLDLTIVVTDNDGGGIFSFLPQHSLLERERYEQLFGTPHGTDLAALVAAHGVPVLDWPTAIATNALAPAGVRVIIATTDRAINLALHDHLVESVARSLPPHRAA